MYDINKMVSEDILNRIISESIDRCLNEADIVTLRKMTMKSKFTSGQFTNCTVEDVYKVKKAYLIWAYFNLSNITFIDEILDMLGITEEWRISKPGTSEEMYEEFFDERKKHWSFKYRKHCDRHNKGYAKSNIMNYENNIANTRGSMAWRNQGH